MIHDDPEYDPWRPIPTDLRRVLVVRSNPGPKSGLIPESWFTPHEGRYIVGSFRIPTGGRIAVAVDPTVEYGTFRIEDAVTGQVVRTGNTGLNLTPPR